MDSILSIVDELHVSDLTPQDCRLILDSISTDSLVGVTPPTASANALNSAINSIEAWQRLDKESVENECEIHVDSSNELDVQRITASALCTLSSSQDPNVRLTAIQLLLAVCSLPGKSRPTLSTFSHSIGFTSSPHLVHLLLQVLRPSGCVTLTS
jgi:hypothetical protein